MASSKAAKTKRELEIENAVLKQQLQDRKGDNRAHLTASAISVLVPWVVILILGLFTIFRLPATLAVIVGQKTSLNIHIQISLALSWIVSVAATGLWWRERQSKRGEVNRLTNELVECRSALDPGRQSSGLDPTGATNREDKP